ncbi:hypothetical protein Y032_0055g2586 [Ancylostoma ceylanicum]|uniref:Uncharacterized protein n=1 Tax=Ancylostoma ceylanicum TaxID=53326 RepID=A0A016U6F1_9BILA|nr:hypothetical protein Y032_0055g2586 [Ancylostoma ceylanicum]
MARRVHDDSSIFSAGSETIHHFRPSIGNMRLLWLVVNVMRNISVVPQEKNRFNSIQRTPQKIRGTYLNSASKTA